MVTIGARTALSDQKCPSHALYSLNRLGEAEIPLTMSAQVKQEVIDLFMREGSSNTKACQKIYYARGSAESQA